VYFSWDFFVFSTGLLAVFGTMKEKKALDGCQWDGINAIFSEQFIIYIACFTVWFHYVQPQFCHFVYYA
jgi:hypothetical protein